MYLFIPYLTIHSLHGNTNNKKKSTNIRKKGTGRIATRKYIYVCTVFDFNKTFEVNIDISRQKHKYCMSLFPIYCVPERRKTYISMVSYSLEIHNSYYIFLWQTVIFMVLRPLREVFTHIETSPLLLKVGIFFTYAQHSWLLSSEGSKESIIVISEDP